MGYRGELAYRLGNVKYAEGGQVMRAAGLGSPAIEWFASDGWEIRKCGISRYTSNTKAQFQKQGSNWLKL